MTYSLGESVGHPTPASTETPDLATATVRLREAVEAYNAAALAKDAARKALAAASEAANETYQAYDLAFGEFVRAGLAGRDVLCNY